MKIKKKFEICRIVLYDRWSIANEPQMINGNRERKIKAKGWFHQWAQGRDESTSIPVAIVELDDGHIELWPADRVGFLKTLKYRIDENQKSEKSE